MGTKDILKNDWKRNPNFFITQFLNLLGHCFQYHSKTIITSTK